MPSRSLAKPIPFVGISRQRSTGTTDERFVNVLFEETINPLLREHSIDCVKRPGLSNSTQPPGQTATGRGVYGWGETGKIYSVFGNRIYSGTSAIGSTLAGTSGMVSFTETPASGTQLLIISDGSDNYNINTLDVVTQIDESDDSHYPTANLTDIGWHGDGYLIMAQSNGKLWNFDLGSYTSIAATSFLSVDTRGGDLVGFRLQKDQIIALTKNRGEFFFNNGNPSGSPFLRIDQNTLYVGCAARQSIACSGEIMCFVGENASDGAGGRSVYQITSLGKVSEISYPNVNRFLDAEGSSISNCTSWMEKINGQVVYVLNLTSRTFVYGVENHLWSEWQSASGGVFNIVSVTSMNGVIYGQDSTNGRIYTFDNSVFRDSGSNFTVTLQTQKSGFGAPQLRKSEDSLTIMGSSTTGNLQVSVSDDDFTTFGTARSIDMSKKEKKISRVGGRFFERAHRFTYADNYSLRLQAWLPDITL